MRFGSGLFQRQIYIFKLDDIIFEFSSTRLLQTSWFRGEKPQRVHRLNLHVKLLI